MARSVIPSFGLTFTLVLRKYINTIIANALSLTALAMIAAWLKNITLLSTNSFVAYKPKVL